MTSQRPSRAARWRKSAADWQAATLTDRFLFNRVMKDKDILLPTLQMIVPQLGITQIEEVNAEYDLEHGVDVRGYRLDIFATDDQRRQYDIEMQVVDYHNLLQRSLAYAASLVEEQLEHGDKYQQLRPVHVIFLTKFDPFSYQIQYDRCELRFLKHLTDQLQPHLLSFTYLNVAADQEETPPPLRRLCRFINSGTVDRSDPFILKLGERQARAKKNKEWRKIAMRINFNQQDQEWAMEQAVEKTAALERKKAALEREKITQERDKAVLEREKAAQERNKAVQEREKITQERNKAVQEREKITQERDQERQTSIISLIKVLVSSGNDEPSIVDNRPPRK